MHRHETTTISTATMITATMATAADAPAGKSRSTTRWRGVLLPAVVLAGALTLAGCGSDDGAAEGGDSQAGASAPAAGADTGDGAGQPVLVAEADEAWMETARQAAPAEADKACLDIVPASALDRVAAFTGPEVTEVVQANGLDGFTGCIFSSGQFGEHEVGIVYDWESADTCELDEHSSHVEDPETGGVILDMSTEMSGQMMPNASFSVCDPAAPNTVTVDISSNDPEDMENVELAQEPEFAQELVVHLADSVGEWGPAWEETAVGFDLG